VDTQVDPQSFVPALHPPVPDELLAEAVMPVELLLLETMLPPAPVPEPAFPVEPPWPPVVPFDCRPPVENAHAPNQATKAARASGLACGIDFIAPA
jgi:hypothetical protein